MSKKRRDIASTGEIFVHRDFSSVITIDTQRSFGLNVFSCIIGINWKNLYRKQLMMWCLLYDEKYYKKWQGESVTQEVDGLLNRSKKKFQNNKPRITKQYKDQGSSRKDGWTFLPGRMWSTIVLKQSTIPSGIKYRVLVKWIQEKINQSWNGYVKELL